MTSPPAPGIDRRLTTIFAIACGIMVANLYHAQALIGEIAPALHLRDSAAHLRLHRRRDRIELAPFTLAHSGWTSTALTGAGMLAVLLFCTEFVARRRLNF